MRLKDDTTCVVEIRIVKRDAEGNPLPVDQWPKRMYERDTFGEIDSHISDFVFDNHPAVNQSGVFDVDHDSVPVIRCRHRILEFLDRNEINVAIATDEMIKQISGTPMVQYPFVFYGRGPETLMRVNNEVNAMLKVYECELRIRQLNAVWIGNHSGFEYPLYDV